MKKILFILLLLSISFAQIKTQQLPDADKTLSNELQRLSLLILNQDPTGLGGSNYKTRKVFLPDLLQFFLNVDTTIAVRTQENFFRENNYFDKGWFFNTQNSSIGTPSFIGGVNGAGTRYSYTPGWASLDPSKPRYSTGYTMELDNLIIRGNLYASTYQLNQTSTSTGDFHFTNAAMVDSVYYLESTDYLSYENGDPIIFEDGDTLYNFPYQAVIAFQDPTGNDISPYVVGDLLECKQSNPVKEVLNEGGYLQRRVRGIVRKVQRQFVYMDLDASSIENEVDLRALVQPGQTFAKIGHTNRIDRDGSIYVDVTSPQSPRLIVRDSINSFADYDDINKVKVVLGNLNGIEDPRFGKKLSGYGLYAQNARLWGDIVITGGSTKTQIDNTETLALTNADSVFAYNTYIANLDDSTAQQRQDILINSGKIFTDASGQIVKTPSTTTSGLYLGSNALGFYNGSQFTTFMANNGNFFLTGTASHGLSWDAGLNTLTIAGDINILGGSANDTLINIRSDLDITSDTAFNASLRSIQNQDSIDAYNIYISNLEDSTAQQRQDILINGGKIFTDNTGRLVKTPTTTPGFSGLYIGDNALGYYNGLGFTTFMSNTGNFFLTGTGAAGLSWDASGNNLTIAGNITILGGSAQDSLNALRLDIDQTDSLALAALDSTVANERRIITDTLGRLIVDNLAPSGSPGLYLDTDYIGYVDNLGNAQVYIQNDGQFFFNGDGTNFISWNGSTLNVRGSLNADDIDAGTIGADRISVDSLAAISSTLGTVSATEVTGNPLFSGGLKLDSQFYIEINALVYDLGLGNDVAFQTSSGVITGGIGFAIIGDQDSYLSAPNVVVGNAPSGTFTTSDNKTVTVTKGIITSIVTN